MPDREIRQEKQARRRKGMSVKRCGNSVGRGWREDEGEKVGVMYLNFLTERWEGTGVAVG